MSQMTLGTKPTPEYRQRQASRQGSRIYIEDLGKTVGPWRWAVLDAITGGEFLRLRSRTRAIYWMNKIIAARASEGLLNSLPAR